MSRTRIIQRHEESEILAAIDDNNYKVVFGPKQCIDENRSYPYKVWRAVVERG